MTPDAPPTEALHTARHWLRLLWSPLGASAATSAAALAGSALLYRVLPAADAGAFALLTAFVQTVLILGGMGQSTLTLRMYSRAEPGAFRWRADLVRLVLFTLPAAAAVSLLIAALYRLPAGQTAFVLVGGLLWGVIASLGSMLASQRRFALAASLPRLPNGLLIVPALLMLIVPGLASLQVALHGQLAAAGAALAAGWLVMARGSGRGARVMSYRQRSYGLVFLASQSATLVPDYLLLAVAGLYAPAADLAVYAAVNLLFRPTQLLQNVLAQVLTTELARTRRPHLRRPLLALLAASLAIMVGGSLLGSWLTHLIYGARYAPTLGLMIGVSLASGLDVLETLPRSYLTGRANRRLLAWFSGSQLVLAVLGLLAGVLLIQRFGIEGAAAGTALIFVARNAVSYSAFLRVRLRERSAPT